jgi:uncharacterized protein (TIGR03437 family)
MTNLRLLMPRSVDDQQLYAGCVRSDWVLGDERLAKEVVVRAAARIPRASASQIDRQRKRDIADERLSTQGRGVYRVLLRQEHLFEFLLLYEMECEEIRQERHGYRLTDEDLTKRLVKYPIKIAMNHNGFHAGAGMCFGLCAYTAKELLRLYNAIAPDAVTKGDRECSRAKRLLADGLLRRFGHVAETQAAGSGNGDRWQLKREIPSAQHLQLMKDGLMLFAPSGLVPVVPSGYTPRVALSFSNDEDEAEMQRIQIFFHLACYDTLAHGLHINLFDTRARKLVLRKDPTYPVRREFGGSDFEVSELRDLINEETHRWHRIAPNSLRIRVDGIDRAAIDSARQTVPMLLEEGASVVEIVGQADTTATTLATYVLTYDGEKRERWDVTLPWSDSECITCTFNYGTDDCVGALFERHNKTCIAYGARPPEELVLSQSASDSPSGVSECVGSLDRRVAAFPASGKGQSDAPKARGRWLSAGIAAACLLGAGINVYLAHRQSHEARHAVAGQGNPRPTPGPRRDHQGWNMVGSLGGTAGMVLSIKSDAGVGISGPAYQLVSARINANRSTFMVYQDQDSGENHGFPSGFFGNIATVHLDTGCVDDTTQPDGCAPPGSNLLDRVHGTVLRVSFDPQAPGTFAGLNIEEPENWGVLRTGLGHDLQGALNVVFDVRSPDGASVQFGVDGCVSPYMSIPMTWTTVTIPLSSLGSCTSDFSNFSAVHIMFAVATNDINAPSGGTVLLDNIRFDPVPNSHQNALSFPLGNQTFGVVPTQNVPVAPDQVLRNLTTIYESALALLASIASGTSQDLANAHLIADAFDYALHHDNHGDPLPGGSDGSVGLHNGYEFGDLALFNSQQPPKQGEAGDIRLAGFTATSLCPTSRFCLVLDGATGGNNAFAILALAAAYRQFQDVRYLNDARTIGNWIISNLTDGTRTSYGGYYLGYRDMGVPPPKPLETGKSTENNADIFAAFQTLAALENQLGNTAQAAIWTSAANFAGDFVLQMFDGTNGRFNAGTTPPGTTGPGICLTGSQKGNDVINTCDFLDSNTFTTLALAGVPRYQNEIDWRRPIQYVLSNFAQTITVGGQTFNGFDIVPTPVSGANGVAWEFTSQACATMLFVDQLYGESNFNANAQSCLQQVRQAQQSAPFGDGLGLVAATLQDGDTLPPIDQCLNTPFQCVAERVGLAATIWAIFADLGGNPFAASSPGPAAPVINGNGIVNNASFAPATNPLSAGIIAAIFGSNMTDGTSCLQPTCFPTFTNGKLNTTLNGAQVTVNGTPAPILYASPGQVGIEIPTELTGAAASVVVTVGSQSSAAQMIALAPVAPGIFFTPSGGSSLGAITHKDGSAVTAQHPAQPGELVILYATGLGAVQTAVPTGELPPPGGDKTTLAVTVSVDGVPVTPDFAGLSGCCVGENQVNVRIPATTRSGDDIPVVLIVSGQQSNTVITSVRAK